MRFIVTRKVKSHTHLPVVAGFGISTKEHVEEMVTICDGVVVGSKVIELLENENEKKYVNYIGIKTKRRGVSLFFLFCVINVKIYRKYI